MTAALSERGYICLLIYQFVEQSPHLGVWRSEIAILRAQRVRGQFAEGFAAAFREEKSDGIAGAIVRLANRSVQEDATVYGHRVHGTCGAVQPKNPRLPPEIGWNEGLPGTHARRVFLRDVERIFLSERRPRGNQGNYEPHRRHVSCARHGFLSLRPVRPQPP